MAQTVKNLPAIQETWVRPLGQEDPLEKGMATHSRRGSAGEYQSDERAGVAGLSWRVSG